MRLFDTHCHLNDESFQDDLDAVIARAHEAGVGEIVIPGVDVASSHRALAIAHRYEGIYAAIGVHPEAAKGVPDSDFDEIEALAADSKVVAIGEIGLDYYWDAAPREEQRDVFARQIHMAAKLGLPIVVHNRDATADTVHLIETLCAGKVAGVMHCFTGSAEIALQCIHASFFISYGGPVTFKNAHNVREVCSKVPLDWLLLETDSPYLTPHPFRGKRNEPSYVQYVCDQMAALFDCSPTALSEKTRENARRLFARIGES